MKVVERRRKRMGRRGKAGGSGGRGAAQRQFRIVSKSIAFAAKQAGSPSSSATY